MSKEEAQQRHPSSRTVVPINAIWYAILTEDMITLLEPEERDALIEELNDAVANICEGYGV